MACTLPWGLPTLFRWRGRRSSVRGVASLAPGWLPFPSPFPPARGRVCWLLLRAKQAPQARRFDGG